MTRWGVFLLVAFIVLGLSPLAWRAAVKYAAALTACVIVALFVVRYGAL